MVVGQVDPFFEGVDLGGEAGEDILECTHHVVDLLEDLGAFPVGVSLSAAVDFFGRLKDHLLAVDNLGQRFLSLRPVDVVLLQAWLWIILDTIFWYDVVFLE